MFLTRNKFRYFGFGLNLILSRLETAPTSRGYEGGYRKRELCDEPARRFAMAGGPHRYYKYWLNGDWLNFMGIKGRGLPLLIYSILPLQIHRVQPLMVSV